MTFAHGTQKLPWKPRREKTSLELHRSLDSFIALFQLFTIQYNVFINLQNLNSNPELENHGLKIVGRKTTKNNPKIKKKNWVLL